MGKKKKFNKKSGITFHLVHRSQQDPLITDETAPQHVLVAASNINHLNCGKEIKSDLETRKKEQQKYGIYFDDEYDYLQHLRGGTSQSVEWRLADTNTKNDSKTSNNKISLPSSVFASEMEEDEGLLHKLQETKGPRPDWDPDVVAALDDDFDFDNPENQLEDNFLELALQGEEDYDSDECGSDNGDSDDGSYGSEDDDKLGDLLKNYKGENKSCFTEYSISSSVIRRNEQLSLLDDKFEKFYQQYDDMEVGPLEADEIEGSDTNNDKILQYAVELKQSDKFIPYDDQLRLLDKERISKLLEQSDSSSDDDTAEISDDEEEKWDCETVISTYSNFDHQPKMIIEPRKDKKISIDNKTGIPVTAMSKAQKKLSEKSLAKLTKIEETDQMDPNDLDYNGSIVSTLNALFVRPKNETAAERRERKRLVKEHRNDRRTERKANTIAFKQEHIRQMKMKASNMAALKASKIE